jgi:flavorubredoxin
MNKKITEKVTWVGKIDWELRRFHGDELSTHKGTSYNSYLIKDEKKILRGSPMTRSSWLILKKR